jgi:hypothetical protein
MQYHRHPDNLIFIRGGEETYCDTLANFEIDYGGPAPGLPEGFNEQFYEPGTRHFFANGNEALPLPLEWVEGDLIISALPALLDIQARRTMGENLTQE